MVRHLATQEEDKMVVSLLALEASPNSGCTGSVFWHNGMEKMVQITLSSPKCLKGWTLLHMCKPKKSSPDYGSLDGHVVGCCWFPEDVWLCCSCTRRNRILFDPDPSPPKPPQWLTIISDCPTLLHMGFVEKLKWKGGEWCNLLWVHISTLLYYLKTFKAAQNSYIQHIKNILKA